MTGERVGKTLAEAATAGRRSGRSEKLERDGLTLHAESQVRHEDEIWVRSADQERVAIAPKNRRGVLGIELELGHRGGRVLQKPRAKRVVGLERKETAVEPVGRGRRESVVRLIVHTGHSTTALP